MMEEKVVYIDSQKFVPPEVSDIREHWLQVKEGIQDILDANPQ